MGHQHKCRILLDSGSQVSFITESLLKFLCLCRKRCTLSVDGVGGHTATQTRGKTNVTIQSAINNGFEIKIDVYVLRSITSDLPLTSVDASQWNHFNNLTLADPSFGTPGKIDMLIGADIWSMIIQDGIISGKAGEPSAMCTRFGWVAVGPAQTQRTEGDALHSLHTIPSPIEQNLDELLRKFWECEEVSTNDTDISSDICEQIFMQTVQRDTDGRYTVQIPFKPDAPELGSSHQLAKRQFHQLERKLSTNSDLKDKYIAFMREYESMGHMEAVDHSACDPSPCYYIPHHAVIEKFRVVFNASAKTTNGVSLNDTQLIGPQQQDPLVDIIFRFRRFAVAITGDVEKMFRQVRVDHRHRRWQQILWRENSTDVLRTYQLTTVTYGMACGPYNAIRALRQCAIDNKGIITDCSRAETAHNSIMDNFYVDDYLDSAASPAAALQLAEDVDLILRQGMFQLRKWNSNDFSTLQAISRHDTVSSDIELSEADTTVLGLHWNPLHDELFYIIKMDPTDDSPTKRSVLSMIARLYDPTGLLAPVVIVGKIFIQRLWGAELEWDEPLPANLKKDWLSFRNTLPLLAHIRVPRWLGMKLAATITIHGFGDASKHAYAAVIYVRTVDVDNHICVTLVAAKTKVAPIKKPHRVKSDEVQPTVTPDGKLTIPRLELNAAQLLVKTFHSVRTALRLQEVPYTLYSDSSIVLCWLKKSSSTFKQFVSNRVNYIQQNTSINSWCHVRSEDNPADCASRGISPTDLTKHTLWWNGPCFLQREAPTTESTPILSSTEEEEVQCEQRPAKALITTKKRFDITTTNKDGKSIPLIERFSSLQRLLHTTALVMRFQPKNKQYWRTKFIATEEIRTALCWHIRYEQGNSFQDDINALKSRSSVESSSSLLTLSPFIDDADIIRVGGRLSNSSLSYNQRHPVIIPKNSPLAALIVQDAHHATLHGGIQEMLQYIRRRYWILQVRNLVKTIVHRCVTCRLHQRNMLHQQMGSLPRSRVLVSPPFTHTGLDYCGPFHIRIGSKRTITTTKTYGVIFVCMVTKAVHIELADDLSTRAFLDVFDRFISRRGYCTSLYSDNGTQFVGANRQMHKERHQWYDIYAKQSLADKGVTWNFIVPASPHHGGLWEAAVKSAKRHLLRVVGEQRLNYQQLNTLLIRIEACLNSRPLISLHDDHEGGTSLSPGDFLIGRPILVRPEPNIPDVPENRLKYWQRLQRMYQHFWTKWQNEYLVHLQVRGKWARAQPNIQVNDVVAILHENLPPTRWRIGRVVAVHPGSDGLVRVATIEYNGEKQNASGTYIKHQCQRPVQKLCRIIDPQEDILNRKCSAGQNV